MMRWPFRYKGNLSDREGKERAKRQLEVAKAIEESSTELAHEHHYLLNRNGFGPSAALALKEPPRHD